MGVHQRTESIRDRRELKHAQMRRKIAEEERQAFLEELELELLPPKMCKHKIDCMKKMWDNYSNG